MELAIVTPEAEALHVQCDEVIAPGTDGEIGLLAGHIPLITTLRPGVLTVITSGKKAFYAVSDGYAEIDDGVVTVLTGSCEPKDSIDLHRAQEALKRVEVLIQDMPSEDAKYPELERRRLRAMARIETAERR